MPTDVETARSDEELAAHREAPVLYGRYARRLLAFLAGLGIARSDLEDVHHEVWVRVWTNLQKDTFTGHFRGWLFQIARNLAIDQQRKKKAGPLGETEIEGDRSPVQEALASERRARLEKCLGHLPSDQEQVVRGKLGGDDYEAICLRLRIAAAQAHKLFFQAKERLESCMREWADE